MNTFLKRVLVLLSLIAIGLFLYSYFVENIFDKPLSPKDSVGVTVNDLDLEVTYNRPSKRGREIFGALVPFDKIWRTGANEATTFSTNKNLMISGSYLPKGDYTLWTKPQDTVWHVYFNSKQYPWGVDETMKPMRQPEYDVVDIAVPVEIINTVVEQFTIAFDNTIGDLKLTMAWDTTKIAVPLVALNDENN